MTHVNMHEHIDRLVSSNFLRECSSTDVEIAIKQTRQKGGIGSSAYDPKQKDIRAFFGGREPVVAQEQTDSNAKNEVGIDMEA